jgi:hypothetical protein
MGGNRWSLVAFLGVLLVTPATLTGSLSIGLSAATDPAIARRDADAFKLKVSEITRRGGVAPTATDHARTTVTESEVNGYLSMELGNDLPDGVVSPTVTLLGQGRTTGQAVVDLDRVRQGMGATGVLNPLRYLRGRLPVVATGTIESRDGVARLQFESATVSGVRVPKVVIQQIVGYYSRSARFPSGVNLDDPFTLPARIREIQVERGQAIVVQ